MYRQTYVRLYHLFISEVYNLFYLFFVFVFPPKVTLRSRASLFFCSLSSGGWVKIKLKLQQFHVSDTCSVSFNPRSRCNSSSRCCYRAREHVDLAWSRRIRQACPMTTDGILQKKMENVSCEYDRWVVETPRRNCASPSPPSHEEGVALLVARTCNEVLPAHKGFLRASQTPVPLICIVCWVLACTAVPGTRYAAPGTRGSRLEYVQRLLVSYNTTAAAVRIL